MGEPVNMDNGTPAPEENSNSSVKNCALCGCSTPAVKCDKCGSQTFCLSCDDMYHRHPKRRFHLRKAVDSIWNTYRSPRLRKRTELPGDPSKIPVPPPRTKKRHLSSNSGFDVPFGYKTFWQQKRHMESQSLTAGAKKSSSLSPAPSQESKSLSPDTSAFVDSPSPNKVESTADSQLPRRSSVDNINPVANPSVPIHVFVPGIGPMPMDRSTLGYPDSLAPAGMHHSASASDLSGVASGQQMPPSYHFPAHMAPFMPPHLNPYSPQLAHFNCPQCISASWSNLMSPNMAAYHQMHMHQHQPWAPPQSPASRSRDSPAPEGLARREQSPMPFQAASNMFTAPVLYPGGGAFSPNVLGKSETLIGPAEVPEQKVISPIGPIGSSASSHSAAKSPSESTVPVQQTIAGDDEEMEEEEEEVAEDDENFVIPEKPTEEWECAHCTYVNPPGSHICDVCCRTSYRTPRETKVKKKKTPKEAKTETAMDTTEQSPTERQATCSELAACSMDMPVRQFPQKVMQL